MEQQGKKFYEKWSKKEKSSWSSFELTFFTAWRARMLGKFGSA